MGIEVRITSNAKAVKDAKDGGVERALEAIGQAAETYAKLNLEKEPRRVDTGRLRNSISHTHDTDKAYIGTNVEYAPYVHFGTVKMAANEFLKNAVMENAQEYKQILQMYLSNA